MSDSFHVVRQQNHMPQHCKFFSCSMEWFMPLLYGLHNGKWAWSAFPPISLLHRTCVNSYQSFQNTGNHEGWLWKTELQLQFLYEVMTGTLFRPFFMCSQMWCFLLDHLFFFPRRGSLAISSCWRMKTAWVRFDSFGAITFLLKNQSNKGKKMKTCRKYGFTHVVYRMQNGTLFATAAAVPLPHGRYGLVGFQSQLAGWYLFSHPAGTVLTPQSDGISHISQAME